MSIDVTNIIPPPDSVLSPGNIIYFTVDFDSSNVFIRTNGEVVYDGSIDTFSSNWSGSSYLSGDGDVDFSLIRSPFDIGCNYLIQIFNISDGSYFEYNLFGTPESYYSVPLGVPLGNFSITKFSGEPTEGLLNEAGGSVFFSPALFIPNTGNQIDIDDLQFVVHATEVYSPPVIQNMRQMEYGPFVPIPAPLSVTNDPERVTFTHEDTAVGTFVNTANLILLANDLRVQYEAHRASAVFHTIADAVNIITAPVAVDLATVTTLLNDIKTKYNAHRTQVGVHLINDILDVVSSPDASGDSVSAALLSNELKLKYNLHRTQIGVHVVNDGVNIVTAVDPSIINRLI